MAEERTNSPDWSEVLKLAACPIDWELVTGMNAARMSWLYFEWTAVYELVAVGPDDRIMLDDVINEKVVGLSELTTDFGSDLSSEIRAVRQNLEARIPHARARYLDGIGRLADLRFLSPSEHDRGKHAPGMLTKDEIISRSANDGASRFFRDFEGSNLKAVFWDWMSVAFGRFEANSAEAWRTSVATDECLFVEPITPRRIALWQRLRADDRLRISLDCRAPIGGSEGLEATCLTLDIDLSTRVVHGFPITFSKAIEVNGGTDLEATTF